MDDITPDMALNITRYDKLMPHEYISEVTPDAVYSGDAKFDTRHKTLLNTLLVYRDEELSGHRNLRMHLIKRLICVCRI